MMKKAIAFPVGARKIRDVFKMAWDAAGKINDFSTWEVVLRPAKSKRTLDQNAKMWAMLTDIAEQIDWVVDGRLQKLEPEEWKDILTAGLKQELRVAQGISGGVVLLGQRTRKMTVKQLSDLIELMNAFGAERGVRFRCPKGQIPDFYWRDAA